METIEKENETHRTIGFFLEITLKQRIHIDSNAVKRKTPEKSSR